MTYCPSVSVIIPTYNRAHLLGRAIESAFAQIRDSDEIIVIDDGSKDHTESVVREYRGSIRYIKTANVGAGAARNRGIREAKGDLVAFLDSDDEWMPGKLELNRQLMTALPDVLFCFSEMAVTMPNGSVERRYLRTWHKNPLTWDEILAPGHSFSTIASLPRGIEDFNVYVGSLYVLLAQALYMFTSTVVVRRREAGDSLRFDEDIPTYEDWICYGRIAKKGLGAYLDTETAWQHGHAGQRLTDADELKTATTRIAILERLWGSDAEFLRQHGDVYQRVYNEQCLQKVKNLLAIGSVTQARAELRHCHHRPTSYQVLVSLPAWLVRSLVKARRWWKALTRWSRKQEMAKT